MKVINSGNTTHEIILIPRFYAEGEITMELFNEETKEVLSFSLMTLILNGYLYVNFDYIFKNNSNFQIKITFENEIMYRGKLFVTNQTDLENYKITKDIFTI